MSSWAEPRTSFRVALGERLGYWLAWRPDWPGAAAAAVAWAVLLLSVVGGGEHGGHAGHGAAGAPSTGQSTWALMCVAMMLPLALPVLRHVARNSMPGRGWAGMAVCASAFLVPSWLLGPLLLPVGSSLTLGGTQVAAPAALLLAVATVWQLTPAKRWAVLSCNRTVPLAPYGVRAWWNCAELGLRQGLRCLAATWPWMALMTVLPHGAVGVATMAVLTVAMVAEEQSPVRRRLLPWLAAPTGLAALVLALVA